MLDLRGQRYGRLVVIEEREKLSFDRRWFCQCDCGNKKIIGQGGLRSGASTSCGCFHKEVVSRQAKTHGLSDTRTHNAWCYMKTRCYNPTIKHFEKYGGRGIIVCARWKNSYESFLADMGDSPGIGYSLDRIDVNGNYEPANCRWATWKQQANNKTDNKLFTYQGETKNLRDWALTLRIRHRTLRARLQTHGWSIERAFSTAPKPPTTKIKHSLEDATP